MPGRREDGAGGGEAQGEFSTSYPESLQGVLIWMIDLSCSQSRMFVFSKMDVFLYAVFFMAFIFSLAGSSFKAISSML